MIEKPNFDYKYDFALPKSLSMRLSFAILIIAAGIFLVAMLIYLYFSEESVKEETAQKAKTELHDAVMQMRMDATMAKARGDSLNTAQFVATLKTVHPYEHSYTLMTDSTGRMIHLGDSSILHQGNVRLTELTNAMTVGRRGMQEVFKGSNISLLIYEPVGHMGLTAAVVCSRSDILASYRSLIFYGAAVFIIGLLILFACCAFAIYKMVHPLHEFTQSAMSIAEGNLDTPLPEVRSQDELLQLRNSFEYMQNSLKQHIEDLKVTTATKEHILSELTIAHDIQMGMIPVSFPKREDIDLFASMKPAREVGGDLYDFLIDSDELFFIIGDVAGKGVPASLYMAVTRTLFRNLAGNYQSASNIVREINRAIASENDSCIFVTLFVGVLDLRNYVLTYSNASHNAPVLVPVNGDCRLLDVEPNVPVGPLDRYDYDEQQIDFPPGTALLLYTDGLTEAINPDRQLFGTSRLLQEAEMVRHENAENAVKFIQQRVEHFANGAEQSDDLTMLFLRHRGLVHDSSDERHIRLKNEMAEMGRLRSYVLSVCREHGTNEHYALSVYLAIEEMVANVVNYAYKKGTRGHVDLYTKNDDDTLEFRIEDWGQPFDPTKAEDADINLPLEERPIGGLGIHLARNIMDSMHYQRTDDGRNVLTMRKQMTGGDDENTEKHLFTI
ncbi:MAG: SpoIIE family protein phosphatase [Prevotella sp.]|nr:SpoIIE family protein phosphatase [Prevotella sp.]